MLVIAKMAAAFVLATTQEPASPFDTHSADVCVIAANTEVEIELGEAGRAQIVFFKRSRHSDTPPLATCDIHEGETDQAAFLKVQGDRFGRVTVEPGTHEFWAHAEVTDRITLEIEPGETYYVQCAMAVGLVKGHPDLRPSKSGRICVICPQAQAAGRRGTRHVD